MAARETKETIVELAQALADPLRLHVLQYLQERPATVSELLAVTGEAQSKLSNHLAILRERDLVRTQRKGRQIVYTLRDSSVAQLLASLRTVAGHGLHRRGQSPQLVEARTCYDHLAGRYGVAVLEALVARSALVLPAPSATDIQPGPLFQETFAALDIDVEVVRRERRRFALACLDWTEQRPHLGGALGAALLEQWIAREWIVKQPGTRAVLVTEAGQAGLKEMLGVQVGESV